MYEVSERIADTLIGCTIAWVFSYVLPSWERHQIPALVARTLAAQSNHPYPHEASQQCPPSLAT